MKLYLVGKADGGAQVLDELGCVVYASEYASNAHAWRNGYVQGVGKCVEPISHHARTPEGRWLVKVEGKVVSDHAYLVLAKAYAAGWKQAVADRSLPTGAIADAEVSEDAWQRYMDRLQDKARG